MAFRNNLARNSVVSIVHAKSLADGRISVPESALWKVSDTYKRVKAVNPIHKAPALLAAADTQRLLLFLAKYQTADVVSAKIAAGDPYVHRAARVKKAATRITK